MWRGWCVEALESGGQPGACRPGNTAAPVAVDSAGGRLLTCLSPHATRVQVPVAGEKVVLGKDIAYPSFGWDNEYGAKEVNVQSFK